MFGYCSGLYAQTNAPLPPPVVPLLEQPTSPAAPQIPAQVTPPAEASQPQPAATASATNTTVTKAVVKKPKPASPPSFKIVWEDPPKNYMPLTTRKGTAVKVPYAVGKGGKKTLLFYRWGAWELATNKEQELRAIADQHVKAQDREDGRVSMKKTVKK